MSDTKDVFAPFQLAKNEFENVLFEGVRTEHYLPAIKGGVELTRANIQAIKECSDEPTFENTVLAMERASEKLNQVAGLYFTLLSAHGTEEHHALAGDISAQLAELESDISLDTELFARVKQVWDGHKDLKLDPESFRLLEHGYKDFARNGALLSADKQAELREVDRKLAALSPKYQQNLLKDTNAFELLITDEADLAGLPESAREQAAHEAKKRDKQGWVITLHAPSMIPFLTYAEKRELREKVWKAYNSRAFGGENDNQDLIREIVKLRHQRARILGYKSHADYVLELRMAERPATVMSFLDRILEAARPVAEQDIQQIRDLARELDGIEDLMPWDFGFYSEKMKKRLFDFDEEELRAYFPLEATVAGMFDIAGRLYKLDFAERKDISVYHEEVRVFEVSREGKHVGLFYMDLFPRDTKQGGAWQTTFRSQGLERGKVVRPHVAIVCSFTPSMPGRPSLLRKDEVRTLFHEFGHALHSLLSDCRYQTTAGTSVYWDFVELPSQIMENWTTEKEALDLFARHVDTGAPIPAELVEKVRKVQLFQAGYDNLRQLNYGYLDMAWHLEDPGEVPDLPAFEREKLQRTQLFPRIEGTANSTGFAHIFAGGYASGYYSYKWAEVLEADAFAKFKEDGIFNAETAESFRANVLSRGNSAHPMDLFVAFRGRQPDPDALLRRDGLI